MPASEREVGTPSGKFSVQIRKPAGPPRIQTGFSDAHGQPVTVACDVCHTTRPANPQARLGMELTTFHQGLKGKHGQLTCISCHHPTEGYQSLRLADGQSVAFVDVMQLCAQCHGPQYRDYQHGSHGGMAGYWDLSKGPRYRNNCVDCHDPHAPRYPIVQPARGPNDRFLSPESKERSGHE